jgi:hypothetical protein
MKKLIIMDLVQICGSHLVPGTSDEKHECMGYDSHMHKGADLKGLASAHMLCPFPEYIPLIS